MSLEREANAYIKTNIAVAAISTGTMVGVGMATGIYFVGKAGVGVAAGGAMIGVGADTLKERNISKKDLHDLSYKRGSVYYSRPLYFSSRRKSTL